MLFYFIVLLILLWFSTKKYNGITSFIPHFLIMGMIALKGDVGCDYSGYLHRYYAFNVELSLLKSKGEIGWYLVEYFTHIYNLDYQAYTFFTGIVGLTFILKAQKKIKYLGFLALIYQMVFVQLGLSGIRQFIAGSILIYAVSIYIFEHQKYFWKFLALLVLAASFHISVLAMGFVLPFIYKMKKSHVFILVLLCIAALSLEELSASADKYNTRHIETTSVSSGAWLRFSITVFIAFIGLNKRNNKIYWLSITIIIFGFALGIISSVALHRFNYYFLPIICLILIRNYQLGFVMRRKMNYAYVISVFYFLFWFTFSRYSKCFIPYNLFFL